MPRWNTFFARKKRQVFNRVKKKKKSVLLRIFRTLSITMISYCITENVKYEHENYRLPLIVYAFL